MSTISYKSVQNDVLSTILYKTIQNGVLSTILDKAVQNGVFCTILYKADSKIIKSGGLCIIWNKVKISIYFRRISNQNSESLILSRTSTSYPELISLLITCYIWQFLTNFLKFTQTNP